MEIRNLLVRLAEDTIIEIFNQQDKSLFKGKFEEIDDKFLFEKVVYIQPANRAGINILDVYIRHEV